MFNTYLLSEYVSQKCYFFLSLLRCNWHCVSLRCTMCWFDAFIFCKIISAIGLINTSNIIIISTFVVKIIKSYLLRNFWVAIQCHLTIITRLYYSPQTYLVTRSLHHLTNISPFPPPASHWQPLFYFLYESDFFDST